MRRQSSAATPVRQPRDRSTDGGEVKEAEQLSLVHGSLQTLLVQDVTQVDERSSYGRDGNRVHDRPVLVGDYARAMHTTPAGGLEARGAVTSIRGDEVPRKPHACALER